MKNHLRCFALACILVGLGSRFSNSAPVTFYNPLFVSIAIPDSGFDVEDLDVRDANNRPIKSTSAHRAIKNLFINNMRDMLLENLTPARRLTLAYLSQVWDIVSGWLKPWMSEHWTLLQSWFREKKGLSYLTVVLSMHAAHIPWRTVNSSTEFFSQLFLSLLLSSTQILR